MSEFLGYDPLYLIRYNDKNKDISLVSENKKLFWIKVKELTLETA